MSTGLSLAGERQCDDLARAFSQDNKGITDILCSPYKRCLETARKSLGPVIRNGVKIRLMRPLSGRDGDDRESVEGLKFFNDIHLNDVGDRVRRDGKIKDIEFVKNWLSLRDMDIEEAQKMREVPHLLCFLDVHIPK